MKIDDILLVARSDYKILVDNQANIIRETPDGRREQIGKHSGGSNVTSVNGETGDVVLKIPSKTSELTNNSDFTTNKSVDLKLEDKADKAAIPTKVSELENDAEYATTAAMNEKLELKANKSEIPTKVSQLQNDSAYTTKKYVDGELAKKAGMADIPVKLSELTNDTGFIKSDYVDQSVAGLASKLYVDEQLDTKADISSIPKVNNGKITIVQDGVEKGSFTLNQDKNDTITLEKGAGDVTKQYVDDQLASKLNDPGVGKPGQFLMKTASGTKWADCSGGGGGISEFAPAMMFALDNPVGGGAPGEGLTILKRPKFNAVSSTRFEKEIKIEEIKNPIEG